MPEPKVLILCDDPINCRAWSCTLNHEKIKSIEAQTADEVLHTWAAEIPDLIVIDMLDQSFDAIQLIQLLREQMIIPILMFLPLGNESLQLQAYRAGVDECSYRPVSPAVFLEKVRAWLRRSRSVPVDELKPVHVGRLSLEPPTRELVTAEDERLRLTSLEFRLLLLLMGHPGRCFSHEEIIHRVWGYPANNTTISQQDRVLLKNVIYRLRRKIEPEPDQPQYILTETGVGYSFNACQ